MITQEMTPQRDFVLEKKEYEKSEKDRESIENDNVLLNTNYVLFEQSERCDKIIEIICGKVKLGFYDHFGNCCIVALYGKGDFLGHLALINRDRHDFFAVVAEKDTMIRSISIKQAKHKMQVDVEFSTKINKQIVRDISLFRKSLEILFCNDTEARLIQFLKNLKEQYGELRAKGYYMHHNLTQSDIASAIGSSRKTTSLLMNQLEERGDISYSRSHIFFPLNSRCNKLIA